VLVWAVVGLSAWIIVGLVLALIVGRGVRLGESSYQANKPSGWRSLPLAVDRTDRAPSHTNQRADQDTESTGGLTDSASLAVAESAGRVQEWGDGLQPA
jgi:hypothetical protein